jgi:hypothetical protein
VLAVRIDDDHPLVAVVDRIAEPRAHCGTHAQVERQASHCHIGGGGRDLRGRVAGAIVDHEDVELGHDVVQLLECARQRLFLLVRRHDHERGAVTHPVCSSTYNQSPPASSHR